MKRRFTYGLAVGTTVLLAGHATAGFVLYDLGTDRTAWDDALAGAGKTPDNAWNFDDLPDFGIEGFDGPLGGAGAGPVPAGFLADKVSMDAVGGAGNPTLVAVGPSAGFGNSSNVILANFFTDTFQIDFADSDKTAFEFEAVTLLGGNVVALTINGQAFGDVNIVADDGTLGRAWGILATDGDVISSVLIADIVGGGAEGIGYGMTYVPAPGAFALLGVAGLMSGRRRRH